MKFPDIDCKIQVFSSINPSEDSEKVKQAILNILPCNNLKSEEFSITGDTDHFQSMEKIYESIHSAQSQRVLKRQLEKHMDRNTTWFYLNKQAAFVERVVLCEETDESPLGPLKVVLTSHNIERIADILVLGD